MTKWRKLDQTWCSWPSQPTALIEMIGGSYLAATPHISYKVLLDSLIKRNIAIHAWSYIPSLDHQAQANEAWKALRKCRVKLESRIGNVSYRPIRLGHSLGCKLHLISPDGGRKSKSFIGLCFNNYKIDSSIPLISKVKKKLNVQTEFSPSPKETMNIILNKYIQPNNLLVKFSNDKLDQTNFLLEHLKERANDKTIVVEMEGNHLTPANAGLKQFFLENGNSNLYINNHISSLIDTICTFAIDQNNG